MSKTTEGTELRVWKKLRDGELVLTGTVMAIVYRPSKNGDYAIYSGRRFQWSCMTLGRAKEEAETILEDLVEIGAT
jgi:hypothetical protein